MLARLTLRAVASGARGMLGLEAGSAAAPGQALLLRHFAGQPGGEGQPTEPQEGAEARSEGGALEAAGGSSSSGLVEGLQPGIEVTQEELAQYSKRQQAYLGVDAERYKHFLPRLSRKELGSYADEEFIEDFEEEMELYPKVPEDVPLYNLRDAVPELLQPRCDMADKIRQIKDENPGITIDEIIEGLGIRDDDEPPPRPGAKPILRWESRLVMAVGVDEPHPANKKAKLRVYLRELQEEAGLSEAALQYIARICGPRYNPAKGELLLTSEKYRLREDNRRHCMEMLVGLVEEGKRAYPAQEAA